MLYIAAITGTFTTLARTPLGARLMAIVNEELKPANLALSRRHGFGSPGHPARVK